MTDFDDVVLSDDNAVAGAVVNWSPVSALPRQITCVDPVALESRFVVDASGHDAVVISKLEQHGLLKKPGTGGMAVERSEDLVVAHTAEIYPGLVVAGMAVSAAYGLPRMGPTFGAMLLSGKKGGRLIVEALASEKRARLELAGARAGR
jgi:ribulose 1,5-bisphosphate synthetase/thiazole synthase